MNLKVTHILKATKECLSRNKLFLSISYRVVGVTLDPSKYDFHVPGRTHLGHEYTYYSIVSMQKGKETRDGIVVL